MSEFQTITPRIPKELHDRLRYWAHAEGTNVNHFVIQAAQRAVEDRELSAIDNPIEGRGTYIATIRFDAAGDAAAFQLLAALRHIISVGGSTAITTDLARPVTPPST